jgi:hypothetical protein
MRDKHYSKKFFFHFNNLQAPAGQFVCNEWWNAGTGTLSAVTTAKCNRTLTQLPLLETFIVTLTSGEIKKSE